MDEKADQPPVKLYVVPGCPLCKSARAWLDRHGIAYEEHDVSSDFGALRAMYKATGQRLVPVVETESWALVRPMEEELSKWLL